MAASVLLLDDDADLRFLISNLAEMWCRRECLAVGSVEELVASADAALACEVALLDVNLGAGKPTGIDAYRWLVGQGFRGRLYFFTGHARSHPLLADVGKLGDVQVLAKPVDSDRLIEVLTCRTDRESAS